MKGKTLTLAISLLCILAPLNGIAGDKPATVNIDQISVLPGSTSTKVVLESTSPLSVLDTYYSKQDASLLIIDLDNARIENPPQIQAGGSSLIEDVRIDSSAEGNFRLLLDMKEKVPYRIYSREQDTIIELNRFQPSGGGYMLDKDFREALSTPADGSVYLKDIQIDRGGDYVEITADLTGTATPHVFVLNNPLRLVVDLHNTLFSRQPSSYAIGRFGVEKVRAAQFQISDPYTITRMVFDLSEPKFYSLDTRDQKMKIAFYSDQAEPVKASPEPAVEREVPEIVEEQAPPPIETPAVETTAAAEPASDPVMKEKTSPAAAPPPEPQESTQEVQFVPQTLSSAEEGYSGEILSMKFKDADLQAVIFYLADFAGLNVTFDPGVTGVVSVNLVDVPWDQALDLLLKQNKMGKVIEGNVLRIAPMGILTREQDEQRRLTESQEMSGPLITKTFTLSYSKADEVQNLLKSRISSRGEIIVDSRTNTLIISEVDEKMALLERLIDVFDTATPQVSIEARIVEASSTFIRNLGVQWGWQGVSDPFYGNQTSLKFPNKVVADGSLIPEGVVTKGVSGPLGGYAINLPAPAFSTAVGFSVANVLDTFRLDMALTALETSGTGRIISSPKVTTQNNQEAEIIQGRQIPVQTVANFTVTTRYVNAALELRATPQITAEGTIIMTIDIQNNAADFANLVNGIPPITRQSARTTVMIPDGGTTVIGGIYRTEDSITREKVPLLHKIPILGNLFKSFARTKQNRELLIFITPRIIK